MDKFSADEGKDRAEIVRDSIELISKKWHAQILYVLDSKFTQFNEIKSKLDGISGKVLSNSLTDLREKNLVRKSESGYSLTTEGKEMKSALDSIADWGEKFYGEEDRKLLIVEDDSMQRKMYSRWMENFSVSFASSGKEVYEDLDCDTDVVLLDRIIGESRGEVIAEKIKECCPEIEVIMITAVEPETDIVDLDVDDYLVKPVSKEEVKDAVERAMARSEKSTEEREILSLSAKKSALDRKHVVDDVEGYDELLEKIKSLKAGLGVNVDVSLGSDT